MTSFFKKNVKRSQIMSHLATGVVGVAAGAAAVTLADREKRKKVGKFITDVKVKGRDLKEATEKKLDKAEDKITQTKKDLKKLRWNNIYPN